MTVVVAVLLGLLAVVVVAPPLHEAGSPRPVHFLVGAAMPYNGDPAALEDLAGARFGVRRTFWSTAKLAASVDVARADIAAGRVPLLSYKVGDWQPAVDGALDAWARSAADQLAALGGTVMVAIHHEPEGDGDIRLWTRMQQRLAPLFDRPHLRFGVILTGYQQLFGPPEYSLSSLWPTGAPIRFLGLDIYQSYGAENSRTGKVKLRWTNLDAAYFEKVQRFCAAKGIDWGLAETGITDRAFQDRPEGPDWFESTVMGVARHGGSFFAYFNSAQNSGANTWALSGAKEQAFLDVLAQPPTSVFLDDAGSLLSAPAAP